MQKRPGPSADLTHKRLAYEENSPPMRKSGFDGPHRKVMMLPPALMSSSPRKMPVDVTPQACFGLSSHLERSHQNSPYKLFNNSSFSEQENSFVHDTPQSHISLDRLVINSVEKARPNRDFSEAPSDMSPPETSEYDDSHLSSRNSTSSQGLLSPVESHKGPLRFGSPKFERPLFLLDSSDEDDMDTSDEPLDKRYPYTRETFAYFLTLEKKHWPLRDWEALQPEITVSNRTVLVDWLMELIHVLKLSTESLFLAINYLDRCLSGYAYELNKLQLVGLACLVLACKFEEVAVPSFVDFLHLTNNAFTLRELFHYETHLLGCLKWQLTVPTPLSYLPRFFKVCDCSEEVQSLAHFLTELALLDHRICLAYPPRFTALSAVALALSQNSSHHVPKTLLSAADISSEEDLTKLSHCFADLQQLLSSFCDTKANLFLRMKYHSLLSFLLDATE